MSQDQSLRSSLLNKKSTPFDKLYQDCLTRIQKIKLKNDQLQKVIGKVQQQQGVKDMVRDQSQYLVSQIHQLKQILTKIQSKYRDPQSVNKLKRVKTEAQKQIERNRVILKDLVTKSFMMKSSGSNAQQDPSRYLQDGRVDMGEFNGGYNGSGRRNRNESGEGPINQSQQQSIITTNQIDYEIQEQLLKDKQNMLNHVDQTAQRINNIMNDMAGLVEEEGQNLQLINRQLDTAHQNIQAGNEKLQSAGQQQKKGRKKYIIVAAILILAAVSALVIFLIVNGNKNK